MGQTVGQGCIVGQGCSVGLRSVGQLDVQEVSAASPRKRRCVLPGAVPPLASAATATRTACGENLRERMLGLPMCLRHLVKAWALDLAHVLSAELL